MKKVKYTTCTQMMVIKTFSCSLPLIIHCPSGKLQYNAQSPDEAALVSAARNFGYAFNVSINVILWERMGAETLHM